MISHRNPSIPAVLLWITLTVLAGCELGPASVAGSINGSQEPESSSGSPLSGKLVITGSSTVAPLVGELARQFESLHPAVRIDVQTGGSGKGIADARIGVADIGMASRVLADDERDLHSHTIAIDGVALIVHQSNPIEQLDASQVVDIYQDRINRWQELGGPAIPITVVHKAEGRATLQVFLQHYGIDNPTVQADVIVGDNEHGVKTVAASRGAIGYVSIGTAQVDAQRGVPIKLLPVAGVQPTFQNVQRGRFPLTRPLNLVTTQDRSELSRAFIEFCQSERVHDIVVAQHFVPQSQ